MYAKEGVGGILISDWFTDWFKGGGVGVCEIRIQTDNLRSTTTSSSIHKH